MIQFIIANLDKISWIGTAIGFLIGVYQYKRSVDLKRAEWIHKIYDSFYVSEKFVYAKINLIYSTKLSPEIEKAVKVSLTKKEKDTTDKEVTEKIDNFLNFFEFVLYLQDMGQIFLKDVEVMFAGFLKKLNKNELLCQYIEQNGYIRVSRYMKSIRK